MTDPGRIVVAGDWHGNTRWAEDVIFQSRKLLVGEQFKIIVQLGDFGFGDWGQPGTGDDYLLRLSGALALADAWLKIVPGNHEDYDLLSSWKEPGYPDNATFCPLVGGRRLRRIIILPRGMRWEWHGRTWLACGGAASPDRNFRIEGHSWWPDEYIAEADVARCVSGGAADVLVSHDRPAGAYIQLSRWPGNWAEADRFRCELSRQRLQSVCAGTKVRHVLHGHYHLPFSCEEHDLGYGPVTVSELDMDDTPGNYRVLNVRTMMWEPQASR